LALNHDDSDRRLVFLLARACTFVFCQFTSSQRQAASIAITSSMEQEAPGVQSVGS